MQYKTITLELLQQRPEIHDKLRRLGKLLPALDLCARGLKASHEAWKNRLATQSPGSDPSQIASEALEIAIQELMEDLDSGWDQLDESAPFSLEAAMAFIRRHTPPE